MTQGSSRIEISQGRKPFLGSTWAQPGFITADLGDSSEQWPIEEPLVESAYLPTMMCPLSVELGYGISQEAH